MLTRFRRFYLTDILDQAGITSTVTQNQINVSINCWSFLVAVVGSFLLDILGRRMQLLTGGAGMTICLFIIAGLIKGVFCIPCRMSKSGT